MRLISLFCKILYISFHREERITEVFEIIQKQDSKTAEKV